MLCAICYHLYNLENVKSTHGEVLLLVASNFTKSDTPPCVFFTFLNCTNGNKSRKASHMLIQWSNIELTCLDIIITKIQPIKQGENF